MQKLLVSLAAFGLFAAPAMAQVAPAPQSQGQQAAPAEKPKTVKKTVCKNVEEERGIGSRLAPTTKICRVVEVPAPAVKQVPQAESGTR